MLTELRSQANSRLLSSIRRRQPVYLGNFEAYMERRVVRVIKRKRQLVAPLFIVDTVVKGHSETNVFEQRVYPSSVMRASFSVGLQPQKPARDESSQYRVALHSE